jgi:hypothetical protein
MQYIVKRSSVRPWWSSRALIDTVYLRVGGDITTRLEFTSETSGSYVEGLINTDGTKRSDAQQNQAPVRQQYKDLKEVDFAFFRAPNNDLP